MPHPERLAEAVMRRRLQLDLRQADLHALGGPSESVTRKIEGGNGADYRASTLAKLDRSLKWVAGSAERIYFDAGAPELNEDSLGAAIDRLTELLEKVIPLLEATLPGDRIGR